VNSGNRRLFACHKTKADGIISTLSNLSLDIPFYGIPAWHKIDFAIEPEAHIASNDFGAFSPVIRLLNFFIFAFFVKANDGQNAIIAFDIFR